MTGELRKSGITPLGDIPWGTHFCQFFETKEELLEILIPFFRAGLENNEMCIWIVGRPMTPDSAVAVLQQRLENFDEYLFNDRIQILNYDDWYLKDDRFKHQEVVDLFVRKIYEAEANGFAGLRAHGTETWLAETDWTEFMKYEASLDQALQGKKAIVLCTYQLSHTDVSSVNDITRSHEFVMSKRHGQWESLQEQYLLELKEDLQRRNSELEARIGDRTKQLERTVRELKKEISEKEKIADELRKSESRYRTLIEQASDAIIIIQDRGFLIEVNNSFCKMVDYSEKELIGTPIQSLIEPADLQENPLRFDLLSKGQSVYQNRQMLRKNGQTFPAEVNAKMLDDGRILAMIRDVTERKKVEEELRRSEDSVRLIIDTIPTMAWTVRPDGVVDYANKQWLLYAGEKEFENPNGIIHPDDLARVMQVWMNEKSVGQGYDDEMRLRRVDGQYRWFLVRTAPLLNSLGEIIKWYGVCIDIHDSKSAQDELRLAYRRLSYHVENTPLAVIEWDKHLNIKRWSARAEEIFGWTAGEVIGINRYDSAFELVHKDDQEAVSKIDYELVNGLVDRNLSRNRNYTKQGKVIYCEWYNSILRDEKGRVLTILSLVLDVTEREKADQTLRQSYDQIRQLTEHLQNVREEERTFIAREIHDELGGQLTALKMDASWLNEKLAKEEKAVKQRLKNFLAILDTMLKSVRKIAAKLRPSLLDNLGIVAAIDWHLKEFKARSGIKTRFRKPAEELQMPEAIKNGLFRIFQESLTNVVRHADAKNLVVELLQENDQLIMRVLDDGRGFPPGEAPSEKTFGILGMKERAAMMGGDCQITSSPGKGTSVTVVIPYKNSSHKW